MSKAKVVSATSPLGESRLKVVVISETGVQSTFMYFHPYEAILAYDCAESISNVRDYRDLRLLWSERRFLAEPSAYKTPQRNRKGQWVNHA